jgi:hypothetical protein
MTCDVSRRTDQAVVEKQQQQLLIKSSNSTEPTRWAMNLPITPHCRLDTQWSYIYIIDMHCTPNYSHTRHNRPPSPKQSCHSCSRQYCTVCGKLLFGFSRMKCTSNFRSTIYTVCVNNTGNDPFAGSPTKTLLRLLLLLNEQVWASSRAMCSCRETASTGQSEDLTNSFNQ